MSRKEEILRDSEFNVPPHAATPRAGAGIKTGKHLNRDERGEMKNKRICTDKNGGNGENGCLRRERKG